MDTITLKRLHGLISLATSENNIQEARTAAVTACIIIKKYNLLHVLETKHAVHKKENTPSSTYTKPTPEKKTESNEQYDLSKLNFYGITGSNLDSLANKITKRFIYYLKHRADTFKLYPIYSVKEIIHIAITNGVLESRYSYMFSQYLHSYFSEEVRFGILGSKRGRGGGYFLKVQ